MLVLFDLDGTLIDSRRGIEHSLRMTLEQSGVNIAEDHDGRPVFLARNAWHLDTSNENWPKVKFLATKEQTGS